MKPFAKQSKPDLDRKSGFTLVELLVVIAIIGVLVALLLPAIQAAREAARRMQCANNQKQIALALLNYESNFGNFPAGRHGCDGSVDSAVRGCEPGNPAVKRSQMSAFVKILPFMEQQPLYDVLNPDDNFIIWPVAEGSNEDDPYATWASSKTQQAIGTRLPAYVCPSSGAEPVTDSMVFSGAEVKPATGDYVLCMGHRGPTWGRDFIAVETDNSGVFFYIREIAIREIEDGTSNTFFGGEVLDSHTIDSSNIWSRAVRHLDGMRTTDNPVNTPAGFDFKDIYVHHRKRVAPDNPYFAMGAFGSRHLGGANFFYADGRVEFITDGVDQEAYEAFASRASQELYADDYRP